MYDANGNRNNEGWDTGAGNRLTSDGTWDYTYDDEGNLTKKERISDGLTWNYGYDQKNQLTRVERHTTDEGYLELSADYGYDPHGNRIEESLDNDGEGGGGATVTRFAYDGWKNTNQHLVGNENWDVWADLDGGSSLTTRYLRGDVIDQIFARQDSGTTHWTLTDRLGSVRDVVDNSGTVKDTIGYNGFGGITSETDANFRGRYAWTGREINTEIELQYNRARWYDAGTGRWISQDPLGFDAGDSNLYRYVFNAHLHSTDPSGLGAAPALNPPSPPTFLRPYIDGGATIQQANPSGWSVISALGNTITFLALQAQAINEYALADYNYHEAYLNKITANDFPKNNVYSNAFKDPTAATVQAATVNNKKELECLCALVPKGTQAFVWQNSTSGAYLISGFSRATDRIQLAFARLDNDRIGRNTHGGSPTTRRATRWARSIGKPTDNAGHAIAFMFGGSGRHEDGNIFPQEPTANTVNQRNVEMQVRNLAQAKRDAPFLFTAIVTCGVQRAQGPGVV